MVALLLALSLVSSGFQSSSHALDSSSREHYRDSIRTHYLKNGAWRFAINSPEYRQELDSAIALSHDDAYLWQQRGMPLVKQMKYELGMNFIDSAVRYDEDRYIDYRAFLKCIFQKSYRSALTDFRRALVLHPGATVIDHEYRFYMGLCFLQLDEPDSATAMFTQCVAHDDLIPNFPPHYLHTFYLGLAQHLAGDDSSAIATFERSLAAYPRFSDAKYYKARCHARRGEREPAIALLREARNDLAEGITINEDNAIYERYPYQIRMREVDGLLSSLTQTSLKHGN